MFRKVCLRRFSTSKLVLEEVQMAEKITKESFAFFALLNLLSDQGTLLRSLFDNGNLKHILSKPGDENKLTTYLTNAFNAIEVIENGSDESLTPFKIIFPKPIRTWSEKYNETLEENVNVLMLETQTYSLFHYRIIFEVLNEEDFVDISTKLYGLLNMIYIENNWTAGDLEKLQIHWDNRLSNYLETFRSAEEGTDLIEFGKLANYNILKNDHEDLRASSELIVHTMSILTAKKQLFEKYKDRIL